VFISTSQVQDLVHLPGGPAFSEANPIKAIAAVPVEGWIQIIVAICLVELATFKTTYESGATLGFDPMGMGKDSSMALKEIKVCVCSGSRLGLIHHLSKSVADLMLTIVLLTVCLSFPMAVFF
jgi:hypothetical protein